MRRRGSPFGISGQLSQAHIGIGPETDPTALLLHMSLLLQALAHQAPIGSTACCIQAFGLLHAPLQHMVAHNPRLATVHEQGHVSTPHTS